MPCSLYSLNAPCSLLARLAGTLQTPVGTYTGDFSQSKMHGNGKFTYNDGSVYVGGFENDERSGKGKLTRPDGSGLEGNFKVGRGRWSKGRKQRERQREREQ